MEGQRRVELSFGVGETTVEGGVSFIHSAELIAYS